MKEKNILGFGSFGVEVAELQRRLSQLSFPVAITGIYDEKTEAAVREFQQAHFCNGAISPLSWELIQKESDKKISGSIATNTGEWEEYEAIDLNTNVNVYSGPIKPLPYAPENAFSRRGWTPDTIILGYTGTVDSSHTFNLLQVRGILATHFLVNEEDTNCIIPVGEACGLGDIAKDKTDLTLPYRAIVVLFENMGPLVGTKEKGYSHALITEVKYRTDVYGEPFPHEDLEDGSAYRHWSHFSSSQILAAKALCYHLIKEFPIRNIVGFNEISSISQSPGPAFPIQEFKDILTLIKKDKENE
jgi:N-acetyl-anhydromuramyl-L-alanine amidase AmpD